MALVDHESLPTNSPLHQQQVIPSQTRAEEHSAEPAGAPDLLDPSAWDSCEVAGRLAAALGARDAKIRELQDAIQHGTYRITPEQIAVKMLQPMLHD